MVEHNFEQGQLMHPATDVVTGRSPMDNERVVNTRYNTDTGLPWFDGPKYLTESTIRAAAEALGYKLVPLNEE
jgi:hypothetical protein